MPIKIIGHRPRVMVSDLGRFLEASGTATDDLVTAIEKLNYFIDHQVTDEIQQEVLGSIARSLTEATKTIVSSGSSTATELVKLLPEEDADTQ